MSEADNGRAVLVNIGQLIELTISDATSAWVAPYLVGPRGETGQDRVLYLQASSGYPTTDVARARLLAGNPGDVIVESHHASCGSACDASSTLRIHVYVNTMPPA